MRLVNNRYDEIQKTVVNMFKKYNINCIPIDCFLICMRKNIKLKKYSDLNWDGYVKSMDKSKDGFCILLEEQNGKEQWYIFYNDAMPTERIRFTIMHELAHIELEHTEGSELAEAEANFFAKYALAPPPLVHYVKPDDYLELSKYFELSKELAFYSMKFYNKWLKYGSSYYLDYEVTMINLFCLAG